MADEITDTQPQPALLTRARTLWREGTPQRRGAMLAAVAIPAVLIALGVYQSSRPGWRAVAHGMLPEDQQAAVTALEARQIPHRLGDAGTILVQEDQIHEARMELAASAMPSGRTVGFELFDESELGRSSFNEKVNYHRALEGELARTIQHLQSVERARVHLVLPERRLFEEDQAEPSASVVVSLRRGANLAQRQVQAIRQLVSSAVERLEAARVSIADQSGTMLTRPDDGSWQADEALKTQTRMESSLERRVVALLEPVFGRGRVRAQVAVDLDFSRLLETEERYNPESQVVRSERDKSETSESEANVAAGAPGVATNVPDRAQAQDVNAPRPQPKRTEKSDTIKNYEIDKSTLRRESPHARVERLSVAVMVDAASRRDAEGNPLEPSDAELTSYEDLIARAVGADTARGDAVEVIAMAFAPGLDDAAEATEAPLLEQPMTQWILAGALAALALLVGLVLWLRARARRKREEQERLEQERLEALEGEPPPIVLPEPEPETLEIQERIAALRDRARRQAGEDLHRTASVLRRWLRDAPEEPATT